MIVFGNIKAFLEGIKDFTETPIEQKGILFVRIKKEIVNNPNEFIPFFRSQIAPLRNNPELQKYFKFSLGNPVGFTFDLTLAHREKLAIVFNKIPQGEIQESVKFLLEIGWTDEQFQREIGLSSITLYRYKSGKFQDKTEAKEHSTEIATTSQEENHAT